MPCNYLKHYKIMNFYSIFKKYPGNVVHLLPRLRYLWEIRSFFVLMFRT
jgi:hypothetical protein